MDKLLEEANNLNLLIKNSEEYKEFLIYKKLKMQSLELCELEKKLKEEKDKVCLKNGIQQSSTESYYKIKSEIDKHPIMVNYQNAYEKFNQYLFQIINIINKDL